MDEYFFNGAARVDDDNYVIYTDIEGKVVKETMTKEKLVTK